MLNATAPSGAAPPNWPTMPMSVAQPQWYQVTCPNCGSQLQVQLPEGITSVQCGNCKAVFAVQIQQTAFQQAKAPGPLNVKRGRKKKDKPARPPRSPSAYNLFMKDEVAKVKAERPELRHRDAFKMAAERWAESPKNPQNKGKPGYEGAPGAEDAEANEKDGEDGDGAKGDGEDDGAPAGAPPGEGAADAGADKDEKEEGEDGEGEDEGEGEGDGED